LTHAIAKNFHDIFCNAAICNSAALQNQSNISLTWAQDASRNFAKYLLMEGQAGSLGRWTDRARSKNKFLTHSFQCSSGCFSPFLTGCSGFRMYLALGKLQLSTIRKRIVKLLSK
jgi:hypothetical protein